MLKFFLLNYNKEVEMIENRNNYFKGLETIAPSEQNFSEKLSFTIVKMQESIKSLSFFSGDAEKISALKGITKNLENLKNASEVMGLYFRSAGASESGVRKDFLEYYEGPSFSSYKSQLLKCIDQLNELEKIIPEEIENLNVGCLKERIKFHDLASDSLFPEKREKYLSEFKVFQNKINQLKDNKSWTSAAWYKFRVIEGQLTAVNSYFIQSVFYSIFPVTNFGRSAESKKAADHILRDIENYMSKGIYKEELQELMQVICNDDWADAAIGSDPSLNNKLNNILGKIETCRSKPTL